MPGELPLVLLALLAERSQGGYELLGELDRRFAPAYRPSPGSVYPALSAFRAERLVEQDRSGAERLSGDARGRRLLADQRDVLSGSRNVRALRSSRPRHSAHPCSLHRAASAGSTVASTATPSSASSTPPRRRSPTWRSAVDSDSQFDQLARRDVELSAARVAAGRRRSPGSSSSAWSRPRSCSSA